MLPFRWQERFLELNSLDFLPWRSELPAHLEAHALPLLACLPAVGHSFFADSMPARDCWAL